ncbi:hypothetical protein brsh051_06560 [Brooklawnia propionicigenes]|jgi:CRISPR system Cascade subunit CasB|uniref:Type I-E CRISPR-associated protein Cse2/CasB n=1 Tax=Brooklawnia propionicigenes TaxID=3041175 RepID=A0AAN0K643_9ACTN|nr:type I-E CRISPR-associated protein Cse2/CasB [Brooklawnia sp. SH051]BEH01375.1 hypothetical protein brsh051_06560 [Brooklawnia sp. SH051]
MTTPSVKPRLNPWDLPRTNLGKYISRRAAELQKRYLAQNAAAKATLAQLRNGVRRPLGSDVLAWGAIFDGFPPELAGRSDEPNRAEVAAHAALSLFAIHMQSAREPMHLNGVGLGRAVRRLSRSPDESDPSSPVMRRFHALGTSVDLPETLHHARGLVQQLRAAGIGLDYGRLAEDFAGLQSPERADGVRLRWARDLYRLDPTPNDDNPNELKEEN